MIFERRFDVIVVGGGHAGTEAALASARMGRSTLLLTHSIETLGQMSCNPSIGGIGKGHLVKEVDALGGAMAIATDEAGIQFRTLNSSKGPAVRATRAQADRVLYKAAIRRRLENQPNLTLFQQAVDDLTLDGDGAGARVTGVVTQLGVVFEADAVVLTTGTFLSGLIHVGLTHYEAGRAGDPPAKTLGARLRELQLPVGRLKTGTPPRLDGRTLDLAALAVQPGDDPAPVFSFVGTRAMHPRQVHCWITHTNERTHEIIRGGLDRSPLFTGVIKGIGPRYCPSIEDKVVRFAERTSHQIFLEPEGLATNEIYPNGISTSLPFDVQLALVRSIKGCERAHILRPGYSIEYDYFDPCALQGDARDEGDSRALLRRADQRHDGLRGSRGAGRSRRDQRGAFRERRRRLVAAPRRGVSRRAGRRSHHARRDRALPDVHVTRRVSTAAARGQRRSAPHRARARTGRRRRRALGRVRAQARRGRARARATQVDGRESRRHRGARCRARPRAADRARVFADRALAPAGGHLRIADDAAVSGRGRRAMRRSPRKSKSRPSTRATSTGSRTRSRADSRRNRCGFRSTSTTEPCAGFSAEVQHKLNLHRPETIGQAARISGITPAAISLLLVHLKRGLATEAKPRDARVVADTQSKRSPRTGTEGA